MLSKIRALVNRKTRPPAGLVVRTELHGTPSGKRRGDQIRVLVGRGDIALVARVYRDMDLRRWLISVDPPAAPVPLLGEPIEETRSEFGVRRIPLPKTRVQAVAVAAAHLAAELTGVQR